ncbi:MAG: S-layer homology domain-containing protein, partial [Firmicutes bacterium]|nr:S-layer homology domain-containing protein [Bacillota bacterium]
MKKIVKKGTSWLVLLAMVLSLCGGFSVPLTAAVSVNEATLRPVKPITPEEVYIDWSKYFPEGWDDGFVGSTGTGKTDINEVISFGEKEEFVYNGEPQAPKLKVAEGLERGVDYEILYAQIVRDETTDLGLKTVDVEACVDAGYYMMVVFGMGAYGGSVLDGEWNQRVFCIEQADSNVVITLPASLSAEYGQTMKDIPLDGFSADKEGNFSWPDPDASVGDIGNNQRVVVFTPADANYKAVRKEVTVVVAPLSACPKDEVCPLSGFSDLDADQWYHDGVHYCLANGTMVGMSDGVFSPEGKSTRAQIVMMLWRLEGSPVVDDDMTFGDVADGAWYEDAVGW